MTSPASLRALAPQVLTYEPASIVGNALNLHPSFRGFTSCAPLLASHLEMLNKAAQATTAIAAKLEPVAQAFQKETAETVELLKLILAEVGPMTSAAGTMREVRRRGALVYGRNAYVIADALGACPFSYLDELAQVVLNGRQAIERALAELEADDDAQVELVLLLALELLAELAGHVEAFERCLVLEGGQVESSTERAHKPKRSTYCAHHRRHLVAATQLDDPAPSLGFTLNAYGVTRRRFSSFIGGN